MYIAKISSDKQHSCYQGSITIFPQVDMRTEPPPISFLRRVSLELGNRSLDALGEPPNPIWVPVDDPDLMGTLIRGQRERDNARASDLRRRLTRANQQSNTLNGSLSTLNITRFSRLMTRYLRHGAASTRPDGFVTIQSMLGALNVQGATVNTVLEVSEIDKKGRFSIRDEDGVLLVRANQGHTLLTVDLGQLMTPIESADDVPVCLHGTYDAAFVNIVISGGLNRMQRQAIQMAIQMAVSLPNDPQVRGVVSDVASILSSTLMLTVR